MTPPHKAVVHCHQELHCNRLYFRLWPVPILTSLTAESLAARVLQTSYTDTQAGNKMVLAGPDTLDAPVRLVARFVSIRDLSGPPDTLPI